MHKLGINYTHLANVKPEECFALFALLGFDSVFTEFIGEAPLANTQVYAEQAAKNGLFYEALHAPFHHINDMWKQGENGEIMLRELCDCIDACEKFGIPKAIVHLSSGVNAPFVNDVGHARFDALIDHAVKKNITVAFENQRKLANIAFAFEIYKDIENVGFCWDTGHEACFAQGMEFMPLFGKKLVFTHIHDNFSQPGGDLHMIPFDGSIDFEKCARHIKNSGYDGTLSLEIFPTISGKYTDISSRQYYEKAFDSIKKFRSLVENI